MAFKGLGAQVSDAVAFQVFSASEGFATALLRAGETPVIVVFPTVRQREMMSGRKSSEEENIFEKKGTL